MEQDSGLELPNCTQREIEMDHVASGSETSIPFIGTEVEYERFSCPDCGQAARFERTAPDEDWSRAGL